MQTDPHEIKIVSTLGPSTESDRKIRGLFEAGSTWFRLNTNHATLEWHTQAVEHVRALAEQTQTEASFFFDLCGPKIRIGEVSGRMHTDEHESYIFTKETTTTSRINNHITVQEPAVIDVLEPGDTLTIGDECITFEITNRIDSDAVEAIVKRAGYLSSYTGLAVPHKLIETPLLTERDLEFVKRAQELSIRYFALSFVQQASDITYFKNKAKEMGIDDPFVIAKVETLVGAEHLEEIARETDIVMVARGDLMIDTGIARFGETVDMMINTLKSLKAPFIVATEMMYSMKKNPSPTRADVMNVHHAKTSGAWGVMLSSETAVGDFPIECVATIREILDYNE